MKCKSEPYKHCKSKMQKSTSATPLTSSKLLSPSILSADQQTAITKIYEDNLLLVAPMGAGKTVIAGTAIAELLDSKELTRVLIVTTPKIAETVWPYEFPKWAHLQHINCQAATGTPAQRIKVITNKSIQVVAVTFHVLDWMKANKLFSLFDGLLIDESTKLKTAGGVGFRSLRNSLKNFKWRCAMTGTPVSEDFEALYAQMLIVDLGKSLGTRNEVFKKTYFEPVDYQQRDWRIKPGADTLLLQAIAPRVHYVPDYTHTLLKLHFKAHRLDLPAYVRAFYDKFCEDEVATDLTPANAAVVQSKKQQIACGFYYDDAGEVRRLSDFRIQYAKELAENLNANAIITYVFEADRELLMQALPLAKELTTESIKAWNAKRLRNLVIHPKSGSHGLQLEKGGHHIIWLSPQWSNDQWTQLNARLWRRGQENEVTIHVITANNTVDEDIVARLEAKKNFGVTFNTYMGNK